MQLESTTIRFCQRCFTKKLRSDQTKYCSYACRSGGELRIDYLDRMASAAMKDACVEWPYSTNAMGYGTIGYEGSTWLVHRVAFTRFIGPLNLDKCALHECDNPPCFNPYHLFKGSRIDNNEDRRSKGRGTKGQRVHSCKLSPEDVLHIRETWKPYSNAGELALKYGISPTQVWMIATKRSQYHIQD